MRKAMGTALLAAMMGIVSLAALPHHGFAEDSREALEQQLKAQQARNDALKQQVSKLEALLSGDVCKDPAAVEAAQKETQALLSAKDSAAPAMPTAKP